MLLWHDNGEEIFRIVAQKLNLIMLVVCRVVMVLGGPIMVSLNDDHGVMGPHWLLSSAV